MRNQEGMVGIKLLHTNFNGIEGILGLVSWTESQVWQFVLSKLRLPSTFNVQPCKPQETQHGGRGSVKGQVHR